MPHWLGNPYKGVYAVPEHALHRRPHQQNTGGAVALVITFESAAWACSLYGWEVACVTR